MCGILGIASLAAPAVPRLLHGRDLLAHRGPDGAGIWVSSAGPQVHIALAHRRLSILDLSDRGSQPLMLDRQGRTVHGEQLSPEDVRAVLVFNGEIYNYVELRDELTRRGHRVRSSGDTEVLLRAYVEWGDGCFARLNGMFALAIWDPDRAELICARDRFGEKPFYYVAPRGRGYFAFASEVKALVGAGLCDPELEPELVYRYFRLNEQAALPRTIWRGVERLLPASVLKVKITPHGVETSTSRYWELVPTPWAGRRIDEAVARFRELFARSVRMRLRSDVPVGTSLSGGIDSSSVVCQVHALGAAAGQKAFTARMVDPRLDESRYVDIVLARTGIPGASTTPTGEVFLEELDRLAYHQEEPFPTTSIFASYLVYRLARDEGITVLLDGQGADELLAGYAHYPAAVLAELARRGRLVEWWRERRALRQRMGLDPVPLPAMLYHWLAGRRRDGTVVDTGNDVAFLSPDVRRAFADLSRHHVVPVSASLEERLRADLTLGHLQELLRYADRNSMAFSREVRLPFLDHELVEFVSGLPRELLYWRGETKRLLRRAMRGLVPDEVLDRGDKIGFEAPWMQWWNGPSGARLRERLCEAEGALAPLVVPGATPPGSSAALSVLALAGSLRRLREIATSARTVCAPEPVFGG
jgi:asparagine synthase (glutamine-hydrolysing)